jgi:hypothetical protein
MANLDDLNYTSISDMQTDEALELLRQIRLSRRIPDKVVRKKANAKKQSTKISTDQAAELLKILTGGNDV